MTPLHKLNNFLNGRFTSLIIENDVFSMVTKPTFTRELRFGIYLTFYSHYMLSKKYFMLHLYCNFLSSHTLYTHNIFTGLSDFFEWLNFLHVGSIMKLLVS